VRTDYTPQRIVSLQPSATVILAALGRLDRVVACTKYCADVCPEVRNSGVSIIADSWTANSQQIMASHADLVIAAVPYQEKAVAEIMKSGARFLGLAPKQLGDIYADIAVIAGMMRACERGRAVIADMQHAIHSIRRQTHALSRPRVFSEEWGKPLITSQPWVAELVEAAGGQFVGSPGMQTTPQSIRDEDPDVIIAAWCGAGDRVPLEKIIGARGWQDTHAARTGRVYCIRDEFLNTPAPTLVQGLRALAAAIHPHHFPQPASLRCIAKVYDASPDDPDGGS
jgi:iron complex transport system substrate-binding protein